jgi:hypothetical protein
LIFAAIAGAVWAVNDAGSKQLTAYVKYVWVQMLPDEPQLHGGRLARAIITEGDRCPKVLEDGRNVDMVRRPSPLQAAFPILICEAKLNGTSDAWIGSRHLPIRPDNPQDIVVIGDTGCRMVHWETQPCRNGVEWPFAAVASSAAAEIRANGNQSFIIHVGDYHYRENPCADESPYCGGSPYGDNWATWEEEFFKPASPLLLAAPWVIMRGNHENCDRAGAGWLFFFAFREPTGNAACQNDLPPYRLSIGQAGQRQRTLVVLDTSNGTDRYGRDVRCKMFQQWIDDIDDSTSIIWLALHQPLLSPSRDGQPKAIDSDSCQPGKATDAFEGIRARLFGSPTKPKVKLLLSGDTHLFQYFAPVDRGNPVQIIAGDGGTKLEKLASSAGPADNDTKRADKLLLWDANADFFGVKGGALTIVRHGFVTLHSDGQTWTVTMRDVHDQTFATCRFSDASDANQPSAGSPPDCDGNPARQAATR